MVMCVVWWCCVVWRNIPPQKRQTTKAVIWHNCSFEKHKNPKFQIKVANAVEGRGGVGRQQEHRCMVQTVLFLKKFLKKRKNTCVMVVQDVLFRILTWFCCDETFFWCSYSFFILKSFITHQNGFLFFYGFIVVCIVDKKFIILHGD